MAWVAPRVSILPDGLGPRPSLRIPMTLRGMFANENGVRFLEIFAGQENVERGKRDPPKTARTLDQRRATRVITDHTPGERTGLVFRSLGDKTSRGTTRAVDLADLLSAGAVGVDGFTLAPRLPLRRDRKSALRACRGAVGDPLRTLGTVNEHDGL